MKTTFTSTLTTTSGLLYSGDTITQVFTKLDRGCLPALAPDAALGATVVQGTSLAQSTTQELRLKYGASAVSGASQNDYSTLIYNLCNNYGVCCYSNLCNGSNTFKFNPLVLISFLLASVVSAKFIF